MTQTKSPAARERHCPNCGASLGIVEDRHHDRDDTCGKRECDRAMREAHEEAREERHREVDRDFGY